LEQRLKILKAMSKVTGRRNIKEFAIAVGLTPTEAMIQVNELVKAGFAKKSGRGYTITEKGKQALKAIEPVATGKEFKFYNGLDQPANLCATSVKEFYDAIKKADVASLDFHLSRGDFENWMRTTVKDLDFAEELLKIKMTGLKGEKLRETIIKAVQQRYSIES